MDVRSMEYILAIAEQGSLSGAAKHLHVSQPTLSVFLSRLETELQIDLFYRDKKRLIPSPAGRIYLEAARRIVQIRDQTYQSIYQLTHEPQEVITIGATPLRGSMLMGQVFPKFHRRFPGIKVEIRECYTARMRELVSKGEINMALGSCCDNEATDVDYAIISHEEVLVATSMFHPLAAKKMAEPDSPHRIPQISISELSNTPFVLMSKGSTLREISDALFAQAGISPPVVFEANNNLTLLNMVQQGAGAGLTNRSVVDSDMKDLAFFSLSPRCVLNLGIFLPKNRHLTLPERYLIYLFICRDRSNPVYEPALNQRAQAIWDEFERQGGAP